MCQIYTGFPEIALRHISFNPQKMPHTFHIPVLGLGYSVDTPIKVSHLSISSVISIVDDRMIERMRKYYASNIGENYIPISEDEVDFRSLSVMQKFPGEYTGTVVISILFMNRQLFWTLEPGLVCSRQRPKRKCQHWRPMTNPISSSRQNHFPIRLIKRGSGFAFLMENRQK
jgi:hypothetical protein